jgi:hypothetical protein
MCSPIRNPLFSVCRALWRPTVPASRKQSRRTAEESRTRGEHANHYTTDVVPSDVFTNTYLVYLGVTIAQRTRNTVTIYCSISYMWDEFFCNFVLVLFMRFLCVLIDFLLGMNYIGGVMVSMLASSPRFLCRPTAITFVGSKMNVNMAKWWQNRAVMECNTTFWR